MEWRECFTLYNCFARYSGKVAFAFEAGDKPIVLVLSSGRPLELIRLEPQVEAIIEMWQPGVAGGTPLAGILSGRVNPSGKLSVTFPLSTGQIPIYYNMRQSARPFDAMGDYQDIPTEPLYPFGYGLSLLPLLTLMQNFLP